MNHVVVDNDVDDVDVHHGCVIPVGVEKAVRPWGRWRPFVGFVGDTFALVHDVASVDDFSSAEVCCVED